MGLTQHTNAVATIREIVNFLLLRGNIGRPGAGACPIRGHSNVQGDRTMGIWEQMPDDFLDALRDEFGFEPPREHGSTPSTRCGRCATARSTCSSASAATSPSPRRTPRSPRPRWRTAASPCTSQTKLNRSHLCHGREALILPCLGRTERDIAAAGEQFVTVEDSMSMVHSSRGRLLPGSPQLRSEVAIVAGIAARAVRRRPAG